MIGTPLFESVFTTSVWKPMPYKEPIITRRAEQYRALTRKLDDVETPHAFGNEHRDEPD